MMNTYIPPPVSLHPPMVLQCYFRKVSKSSVRQAYNFMKINLSEGIAQSIHPATLIKVPIAQPLNLAKGYWNSANELGYWREWRELDEWMRKLADEKVPGVVVESGMPIVLTHEDVERLRLEATFGDLWSDWGTRTLLYTKVWGGSRWQDKIEEYINANREALFTTLNKMQRIILRNASIVHYVGVAS